MASQVIRIRGARQNNLKHLDLDIPLGQMVVITGVSGAGKSSLAFDTIYAEGQRRYVETFSAYARQFLERMDKPAVDELDGVPAAIAIEQRNSVRASRSTVGTLTELADYLKLLYARMSTLVCAQCQNVVQRDTLNAMIEQIYATWETHPRIKISFQIAVPAHWADAEVGGWLQQQGFVRFERLQPEVAEVVQDRLRLTPEARTRLQESLEAALRYGQGRVTVASLDDASAEPLYFSDQHQCARCDINYAEATPSVFSFNSPIGACATCRGFGRLIGVDYGLVIPNTQLSLGEGAIKPIQTPAYREVQQELETFAKARKIPLDQPWRELTPAQQDWVIRGEGGWDDGVWYGL
jgi:excinuclease ABC subunit A